ncbi:MULTISPECIES: hypothetical protein [Staphylococcus]|jgi:hypothetical protein|uniref:Uncharacterized protein n=2 Tax=Staphylococcus TaxID=1279 RepID=A0A1L7RUF0_STAXY|nr:MULTISPECIES: hypothetical protein [Staphylococcus]KTW21300.1 hypothetical protein NS341_11255 [Staphylococcus xylosus]MCD8782971.1 hypothetical protein [Staphylococcus xylosus]MCD8850948.1 hypothetical protein [Staphylococcus xylosus]MDW8564303.1 hypothetical protein [Staphylococcus shinii]MDW8567529.1 hypothetical protein [Staphylococcus shinii]
MGLSTEYRLKQSNSNITIDVIPLDNNRNRVFGLHKYFGIDEYIISNERLEEIKRTYRLERADQTSIFDYL